MSNENTLALVADFSFKKADEIVAGSFDYEGNHDRKRIAIAMNLIAMASANDPTGLKHLWKNNMIDAVNKTEIIRSLKKMRTVDADEAIADIWDYMSAEDKQFHLNNHPDSRFHILSGHTDDAHDDQAHHDVKTEIQHQEQYEELKERHKRRVRNKARAENRKGKESVSSGDEDEEDNGPADNSGGDWWEAMTLKEQRQYLRDHPGSKKARRMRVAARALAMKVMKPIHHAVRQMGHDYRNGMEGLRALRSGRKMSDEQKEGLKKTAKRVAKILVVALAASAMFTPLGPFAMDVGNEYFDNLHERAEELAKEHEVPDTPTTVGTPGAGPATETTVGEVQAGVNLHDVLKPATQELHKKDEMELEWMRRDMTEWLIQKVDVPKLAEKLKDNAARNQ